jgi:DNA-binding transcriptional MerR regulator/methylmalonyl-CoA mutase cobalamin-binding subunit
MYTIKEASTRSGVGIPLLRAWERRYGVVSPLRTASGYRLYDDAAIDRLRAMRSLTESGWSARQASEHVRSLPLAELTALAARDIRGEPWLGAGAETPAGQSLQADLIERLVDAARLIDGREIEAALDEAFAAMRFEAAIDRIVVPALSAIGEAWERGVVDVAGEHAASHAVLRRLAMAFEAAGDPSAEHPILIGLGPGSHHELGAFAFATAARRAGHPILYLGPDLPTESWVAAARTMSARGAVVGAPSVTDARRAREVIDALRDAYPDMILAVGGRESRRVARATGTLELPETTISDAVAALSSALAEPADRLSRRS